MRNFKISFAILAVGVLSATFLTTLLQSNDDRDHSIEAQIASLGLVESKRAGYYSYGEPGFHSYYVAKSGDDILINEPGRKHVRAFPPEYSIESGKYTGTDGGEWGGELAFESIEGERTVILEGVNVYSIVPYGQSLFVMTGIEHFASAGQVYVIPDIDSPLQIEKYSELPDAPVETLKVNFQYIIVGHQSITRLIPFEVLTIRPFKGILVTSAVQIDDETLLVGLWSGLALVKMNSGYWENWETTVYVEPQYRY